MRLAASLLTASLLAACGPSAAEIRTARDAAYKADRVVVWNAIVRIVKDTYGKRLKPSTVNPEYVSGIAVEDAQAGVIITHWHKVDHEAADPGQTDPSAGANPPVMGTRFVRIAVALSATPPWRVTVDGEGARYRPGMTMLSPYKRGSEEEPGWVQGRIDRMVLDIYGELGAYVDKNPPPGSPPSSPLRPTVEAGK